MVEAGAFGNLLSLFKLKTRSLDHIMTELGVILAPT